MPAGISALAPTTDVVSFDHEKHGPAFTILQKDALDNIGLPIIHFEKDSSDCDSDSVKTMLTVNSKNATNTMYNRRRLSKSNDHLLMASLQSHQTNPIKSRHSKSHSSLKDDDRCSEHSGKSSMILSTEDFNEVLNAKLRKIQEQEEEAEQARFRNNKCHYVIHPKPFITTVKTGEFLMPPPEVAALLGITSGFRIGANNEENDAHCRSRFKHLMSLNKRPEVRHQSHNARCPVALKATEEFSYCPVNTSSTTTASLDERVRKSRKSDFVQTQCPQMPRALPKKLEPIEGDVNTLLNRGDQPVPHGNIMYDRRVVRGSTYASATPMIDCEQSQTARQAEAKKRQLARKRTQAQASRTLLLRSGSPPPVPGRKHEPVQTEMFLEELFEKPEESEIATQTDYFLERPTTPPHCPIISGKDACTQIEPGEIFDYDEEVQPILEVLVGKTIEQALVEVLEEEEIEALKEQQRRFMEIRAAEKAEQQRLEEQERRYREETDRRLEEHEEAIKTQQEMEDRVAATALLTSYIGDLLPSVLESLKISGYLLDEIKTDVEEGFMQWLMKEVKKEMGTMIESRELLMEIIKEILENRAETYKKLGEMYDNSKESKGYKSNNTAECDELSDINYANYEGSDIQEDPQ